MRRRFHFPQWLSWLQLMVFGITIVHAQPESVADIQYAFSADRVELPRVGAINKLSIDGRISGTDPLQITASRISADGLTATMELESGTESLRLAIAAQTTEPTVLNDLLENARAAGDTEFTGGTLELTVGADFERGAATFRAGIVANDLSAEGVNVAEALDMSLNINATKRAGVWDVSIDARHTGGAFYMEPGLTVRGMRPGFVIEAGDEPLTLALAGRWSPDAGELIVTDIDYVHPQVLTLELHGSLNPLATPVTTELAGTITIPDLAGVYRDYVQPLSFGTLFKALDASGALAMEFRVDANGLVDFVAEIAEVYLHDNEDRFGLFGLNGTVALHEQDFELESGVRWEGVSLYKINFGAGAIQFLSQHRELQVYRWQDIEVFDGLFSVDRLDLAAIGTPDMRIEVAGHLSPVSLSVVTDTMGWPVMQGTISGTIPRLHYFRNEVVLDGAFDISAFEGAITISAFRIEDFFTTVPRLYADVDISDLDLSLLTSALSFGSIQGHLDGYVRDLRMESWQPVSFDALLRTPEDDDLPHRISRKAVDNLGRLGAGASGALSNGWLRFLPQYSYGNLGISCRLRNGYCELGGVADAAGGGFYVLTRGGLLPPWIDVKGSGRMVEWATLVDGIRQITRREMVVDVGAMQN